MAFWGIEVKPGKPVSHHYDSDQGRLRVSQATLGLGSSTKKSIVQCQAGNQNSLFLCSLLPGKCESCQLDLEFEEEDEVVFSVLGSTSVHLTGYFLGPSQQNDSDSYREDIDAEIDDSSDHSEDEYVIDDHLDEFPVSSIPNSGVTIEEIIDDEKPANGHASVKRKKKKNQKVESNANDGSKQLSVVDTSSRNLFQEDMESEDEDGLPLSPKLRNKSEPKVVEAEEKTAKAIPDDGNSGKKHTEDDRDPVNGVKRKADDVDGVGDPEKKVGHLGDSSGTSGTVIPANGGKQKKKKKEKIKKDKPLQAQLNESPDKTEGTNVEKMEQDTPVIAEPVIVDKILNVDADNVATDTQNDIKKKKKKKAKTHHGEENAGGKEHMKETETQKDPLLEDKIDEQPRKGARTFSNGLVIEELSMGKPDGKRASLGSKVSVFYIGKLKKNGQIFDSNIGQRPFKFRLGIGQVIKGWDVGVKGMRIGDKRRITIPPEMGYGAKGHGKIPGDAWLVFAVELVSVQ